MTAKEKAKELVERFENITFDFYEAKQCALICVDEIIEAIPIYNPIAVEPTLYYWQEVKQEIEKL